MKEKKVPKELVTLKPGQLSPQQFGQLCELLNRAFFNYPFGKYAFPDPGERAWKAYALFELIVRYGLKYGQVWVTSMNFEGMVIWLPPEAPTMTNFRMLRSGMLGVIRKVGFKSTARVLAFSDRLDKAHKEVTPFPHWCCLTIGVHPDLQGRGYGKRLLGAKIEEAGRSGVPICLETQDAGNVEMYRSFGFEVMDKSTIPGSDVTSWIMGWSPPNR